MSFSPGAVGLITFENTTDVVQVQPEDPSRTWLFLKNTSAATDCDITLRFGVPVMNEDEPPAEVINDYEGIVLKAGDFFKMEVGPGMTTARLAAKVVEACVDATKARLSFQLGRNPMAGF